MPYVKSSSNKVFFIPDEALVDKQDAINAEMQKIEKQDEEVMNFHIHATDEEQMQQIIKEYEEQTQLAHDMWVTAFKKYNDGLPEIIEKARLSYEAGIETIKTKYQEEQVKLSEFERKSEAQEKTLLGMQDVITRNAKYAYEISKLPKFIKWLFNIKL